MADPLLSAIIDTYYRPAWLRQAAEALLAQSYGNLELILVDNGSTPETKACLRELKAADRRVKVVEFAENQYSPDDPLKMLDTCLNAGLRESSGELIWYQADDDLVAPDYAERMVRLFGEDASCAAAAGLPVAMDGEGRRLPAERKSNFRPRWMPGRDLALAFARGDKRLFAAPGTIFTVRRAALERAGGFNRELESQHLFCVAPTGPTGFDEEALFFWRRHDSQLNKSLNARGWLADKETRAFVALLRRNASFLPFSQAEIEEIAAFMENGLERAAGVWFYNNLASANLAAAARLLGKMGGTPGFWRHAAGQARGVLGGKVSRLAGRLGL